MTSRRPLAFRVRRAHVGALLAAGAAVLAVLVPAVPSSAAGERYVALGDSYASGLGTRDYLDDGTQCRRSARAYPSLVAAARGYTLDLRACSGAVIGDVQAAQLGALTSATRYVTVSVGGNDAGFADVLTECALPGWASDCDRAIDDAQTYISSSLGPALGALYAQVRSRAPQARAVVVGYPRVFMGEDCNALTWFSPAEQSQLNRTADQLNGVLAARARSTGFSFANPTSRFVGHAVCDSPEWLNGLSYPVEESYHPNVAGHRDGYTPLVGPVLTGATVRATTSVLQKAEAAAPAQAERQADRARLDRAIEPKEFVAPDLNSPRVRAAAKRLGIDVSDRAAVDRADRRTW